MPLTRFSESGQIVRCVGNVVTNPQHHDDLMKLTVGVLTAGGVGRPRGSRSVRPRANIRCPVLVCIGADDPIIPAEHRAAFENEMSAGGVDWQMHVYGGAQHTFTNPAASGAGIPGIVYDEAADRRSWAAMLALFAETIGK